MKKESDKYAINKSQITTHTEPTEMMVPFKPTPKKEPHRFQKGHQERNGKRNRPLLDRLNDDSTRFTKVMLTKLAKHFGCAPKKRHIKAAANANPDLCIAWDSGLRPAKLNTLEKISQKDISRWNQFVSALFDPDKMNLDFLQIAQTLGIPTEQACLWHNEVQHSERYKAKGENRRRIIDDTVEALLLEAAIQLSAAEKNHRKFENADHLLKSCKDLLVIYNCYYNAISHQIKSDEVKEKMKINDRSKAPKVELVVSNEKFDFEEAEGFTDIGRK